MANISDGIMASLSKVDLWRSSFSIYNIIKQILFFFLTNSIVRHILSPSFISHSVWEKYCKLNLKILIMEYEWRTYK